MARRPSRGILGSTGHGNYGGNWCFVRNSCVKDCLVHFKQQIKPGIFRFTLEFNNSLGVQDTALQIDLSDELLESTLRHHGASL